MTEATVADNIENTLRQQLNPPPGKFHEAGPLFKKKQEFLKQLEDTLTSDPAYQDENVRKGKLKEIGKDFDDKIVQVAKTGAEKGSDPAAYKKADPTEQKTKEGIAGMLSGIFDALIGWITGGASWIWSLIKPMFGNMFGDLSEKISDSRSDETKAKETRAAGIASALDRPIIVAGREFSLTQTEQGELYRQLKDKDFSTSPQNPVATVIVPSDVKLNGVSGGTPATSDDHTVPPPVSTANVAPEKTGPQPEAHASAR